MKLRTGDKKTAENSAKRSSKKPVSGRVTPPNAQRSSGRYTEPIPQTVRHSPRWYPYVLLALLLAAVITIILNYIDALPNSPSNWYTLASIVAIVVAAVAATNYR